VTHQQLPDLARRLAVYLIADPEQTARDLLGIVDQAIDAGISALQLRAKRLSDRQAFELGAALAERCRATGTLFVVNDRVDLALLLKADGVHLGVADVPIPAVRALVRDQLILGFSPETNEQASTAADSGADYLGIGPVFGTASKPDAGEAIGLDTLRHRIDLCGIPCVGVGGIDAENAGRVIAAGAVGVAVVSAVLRADDPVASTNRLAASVHAALAARRVTP
jgi:thiamine-phosphate diphosphorylase